MRIETKVHPTKEAKFLTLLVAMQCNVINGGGKLPSILLLQLFERDAKDRVWIAQMAQKRGDFLMSGSKRLWRLENRGERVEQDIPGPGGLILERRVACDVRYRRDSHNLLSFKLANFQGVKVDLTIYEIVVKSIELGWKKPIIVEW